MTWVEVVSDVVKIGLGAIVGGAFALITARQAYRIRKDEEYSRRRRDQLERISEDFDEVSRDGMMHVASLHSIAEVAKTKKAKKLLVEATNIDSLEVAENQDSWLHSLHSVEARLALLSLPHIAEAVEDYRKLLTDLTIDGVDDNRAQIVKAELSSILHSQRTVVITLMAEAYQKM